MEIKSQLAKANPEVFMSVSPQSFDCHEGGQAVEQILRWTQEQVSQQCLINLKEDYFSLYGKVFDDEPQYEARMSYFVHRLVFDTPLIEVAGHKISDYKLTPFVAWVAASTKRSSENLIKNIYNKSRVVGFRHSVFEILEVKQAQVKISDLCNAEVFYLVELNALLARGLKAGDIVQGFLYLSQNSAQLSDAAIFHPPETKDLMQQEMLLQGEPQSLLSDRILGRFAQYLLKLHRHPKALARDIYCRKDPSASA